MSDNKEQQMEQPDPRTMATNTDPGLNKAFAEESGVSTGYEGIEPAPDPDLGEEATAPEEEQIPDAMTAFIVLVQGDGNVQISLDLGLDITVLRQADLTDVRRACDELLFNLRNQAVSENTVLLLQQTTQQMVEQQRIAKVQQKLASKGVHLPGGMQ